MKRGIHQTVTYCVIAVFAWAAVGMSAEMQPTNKSLATATRIQAPTSVMQHIAASRIGGLTHNSLAELSTMGDVNGQMYGAGKGVVARIGPDGLSDQIQVPVQRPSGLAAFGANKLILGDASNNSVFAVDTNTKQTSKLFALGELNARGIAAASVLQNGQLGGLAFDGKFIYAGVLAGYSSSIFKIDPSTKRVVGHAWAPGPNPTALHFYKDNLFVLEGVGQVVRRFDGNLKLSFAQSDIGIADGKGLIVTDEGVQVLSPSRRSIEKIKIDTSQLIKARTTVDIITPVIVGPVTIPPTPQKYAVLICGDAAESGYDEFWNDTVWIYKMLRNKGYTKENIYVLYGYGVDYPSPNPKYQMPGETVTDFAATVANVNMIFDGLKNGNSSHGIKKMNDTDTLFVWTFDHGGGGPTNSYLCLWDGSITDTAFAAKLNALPYAKRVIFMQQCRSGGFIDNLDNSKTFISTACRGSENAHRADTENESWGGKVYHHGEYNYYVISAFDGKTPTGKSINADTSGNGKVSAAEGHNWMATHENQPEVSQYSGATTGNGFHLN